MPIDIEKSYDFPFPRERVYAAWVSSDTVIPPATSMDVDPRVGGHYRLYVRDDEWDVFNEGRFLAVDEAKHLRYTWEWNNDGKVTEIDVRFEETPEGTRITLLHSGFTDQESADNHSQGWDSYFPGLAAHIAAQG